MTWEKIAVVTDKVYGSFVDWEERFFICPDCDEPIYDEDWAESELTLKDDPDSFCCPICGWSDKILNNMLTSR